MLCVRILWYYWVGKTKTAVLCSTETETKNQVVDINSQGVCVWFHDCNAELSFSPPHPWSQMCTFSTCPLSSSCFSTNCQLLQLFLDGNVFRWTFEMQHLQHCFCFPKTVSLMVLPLVSFFVFVLEVGKRNKICVKKSKVDTFNSMLH